MSERRFVEPTPRWVRVQFGGQIIADSKRALLLVQYPPAGLPTYYFPADDVRLTIPPARPVDVRGRALWDVRVGDNVAEGAAWTYAEPDAEVAAVKGYVTFQWSRMDAWYEEDEQVFVHARDPYKRVDVLRSSRHVRIAIGGTTVAETKQPYLLFETGLPTRYYIEPNEVNFELLEPSPLKTRCPYKGVASYWSATLDAAVAPNVVWSYQDPIPECPKIRGLLAFFNEHVDIFVDGELQDRPQTEWSRNPPQPAAEPEPGDRVRSTAR
jgi:uncharacterized protein (DUF427 family)